jgi:phosphoribosyl 1,2-cyclic phosphodiesterase
MLGKFQILGSSSLGNCAFLDTGNTKILIDAGFSGKRINEMLAAIGESVETLQGVFLTHEHSDHAQGVRGLVRQADLPIFANRDTADAVQAKLKKRANWQLFETGTSFNYRDLEVRSFALPHDAYDPVGYSFRWGAADDLLTPPQSLAWVTDLGYVPEHIHEHIRSVDTLVIEANYDENLLEQDTKRPWSTKQRIRGRHGHLSNNATFDALQSMNGSSQLKKVYLAHLSKDCNTVDCINKRFASLYQEKNFEIHIIDPSHSTLSKPS